MVCPANVVLRATFARSCRIRVSRLPCWLFLRRLAHRCASLVLLQQTSVDFARLLKRVTGRLVRLGTQRSACRTCRTAMAPCLKATTFKKTDSRSNSASRAPTRSSTKCANLSTLCSQFHPCLLCSQDRRYNQYQWNKGEFRWESKLWYDPECKALLHWLLLGLAGEIQALQLAANCRVEGIRHGHFDHGDRLAGHPHWRNLRYSPCPLLRQHVPRCDQSC